MNTKKLSVSVPQTIAALISISFFGLSLIQLSLLYKVSTDYLLGLDNAELIDISNLKQGDKEMIYTLVKRFARPKNTNGPVNKGINKDNKNGDKK